MESINVWILCHRSHEPGFPYFSTGGESATTAAELVILASPFAPILTIGGIDFPVGIGGELVCLCFEDTAETSPPPITTPAVKQAAWRIAELGIFLGSSSVVAGRV